MFALRAPVSVIPSFQARRALIDYSQAVRVAETVHTLVLEVMESSCNGGRWRVMAQLPISHMERAWLSGKTHLVLALTSLYRPAPTTKHISGYPPLVYGAVCLIPVNMTH